MARLLRMDEMGPHAVSRDLEACQTSSEALPDEEVAARVRATISGAFPVKDVNGFPMMSDEGYLDLVRISSHRVSSHGALSFILHI